MTFIEIDRKTDITPDESTILQECAADRQKEGIEISRSQWSEMSKRVEKMFHPVGWIKPNVGESRRDKREKERQRDRDRDRDAETEKMTKTGILTKAMTPTMTESEIQRQRK